MSNAAWPAPPAGRKTSASPRDVVPLTRMSLWFRGPSPIVPEAASAPEGNFQSNCSMCIWPFSRRSLVGACCAIGNCPAEMANVVATIVPSTALRSNAVARRSSARRTSPERVRARGGRLPARSGAFCSRYVNCAKASPEIDARSAPPRMLKSTLSGPSALSRSRDAGGKYLRTSSTRPSRFTAMPSAGVSRVAPHDPAARTDSPPSLSCTGSRASRLPSRLRRAG